jgi:carbonic anhydrase/acetyltransferase-like protein (isoleucine patch superfamily)
MGSRATIVELGGVRPTIGEDVWLAPTAVLIGDVRVGDRANIWFGAVLRGDSSHIEIGAGTSVQDNSVIHCAHELPTIVGEDVVVGHGALLEGCVVGDGAVIGMGAIAPGMLAAGIPATEKKELSGSAQRWTETAAAEYQTYRHRYLTTAVVAEGS